MGDNSRKQSPFDRRKGAPAGVLTGRRDSPTERPRYLALSGNEAVAQAMRQVEPAVVAAYPITPQTEIVQIFSTFVADGAVRTEFIAVESEHSAMSATVGASASGVRAMTATASNGLAFMFEVLYIASGLRLPIVMPVTTRALSAPINIHCDHSDIMGTRDSGWIQIFSESAQEAYDNIIQAVRIAEDHQVRLPVMVALDGFIVSHGMENVNLLEDEKVRGFIGDFKSEVNLLSLEEPVSVGPLALQDSYFEFKYQQEEAMRQALQVIPVVGRDFGELTGRAYGLVETHGLEEARVAVVSLGSMAGNLRFVIDQLRGKGVPVGSLKIRAFRPFPAEEAAVALAAARIVVVFDRATSFSTEGGPLGAEIRAALQGRAGRQPQVINYIYGLGGRDVDLAAVSQLLEAFVEKADRRDVESLPRVGYLGLRAGLDGTGKERGLPIWHP